MGTYLLSGFILVSLVVWLFTRLLRSKRRKKLLASPLPEQWSAFLVQNVPLYRLLPEPLRQQLQGYINVFLDEKSFIGCEGLEITDEIRVTIAAQACILLLNRKTRIYPTLSTILVYPDAYMATETRYDGPIEYRETHVRSGESWHRGPIVLGWSEIRKGTAKLSDGENVVLHEFAHQLDQEDEQSDGVPLLDSASQYRSWAKVLSLEYNALRIHAMHGTPSLLNYYGASSPAEFFAVVTEVFFENPLQLQRQHPDLYEELRKFYKLNPVDWHLHSSHNLDGVDD